MKTISCKIFLLLSLATSFTPARAEDIVMIGYKAYFEKINRLKNSMFDQLIRYQKIEKEMTSDIEQRNCVVDRLVIVKSLINIAEDWVTKIETAQSSLQEAEKNKILFEYERNYLNSLTNFHKTFARFQKLLMDIDICLMKFDSLLKEDEEVVVVEYKR